MRQRYRVPGMSAALVADDRVVWTRGFGHADVASGTPATPDTVYHLASLTKPCAAVVLLQLVEAGRLDLDAPVSQYGVALESPGVVRVRHLLTHTSEGVPGERYHYNGSRFALLDRVIAGVTGTSFATELGQRILEPLGLYDTAPNPRQPRRCAEARRDADAFARRLATGYDDDGITPVAYQAYFGTAAGLVSTVGDMARFAIAVDTGRLLRPATRELAFTPAVSPSGAVLPYGLGWFVQEHRGTTLRWHYGLWTGTSSLIVTVPERRLTFILLANSAGVSLFGLGSGDVLRSPFARAFLDALVP